jgi:hypothetical protein
VITSGISLPEATRIDTSPLESASASSFPSREKAGEVKGEGKMLGRGKGRNPPTVQPGLTTRTFNWQPSTYTVPVVKIILGLLLLSV